MSKWLFLLVILLISCTKAEVEDRIVNGMKPVYLDYSAIEIKSSAPRPYNKPGQIVYRSPFIFIGETWKGVHLIDVTDPALPVKVGFIEIPGIQSFNLKEEYIYAKSGGMLVVVDINDYRKAFLVSATELFKGSDEINFPEQYIGAFECYDPLRGIIVGWEEAELINPKCRR